MSLFCSPYHFAFIDAVSYYYQREGIPTDSDDLAKKMALDADSIKQIRKMTASTLLPFAEIYTSACAERGPIEHSCHAISHGFAETFLNTTLKESLPLAITIGNVWFKGANIYGVTRDKVDAVIRHGFDASKTIDVHVWLTLSDMTVIDLSILSTLHSLGLTDSEPPAGNRVMLWRDEVRSDFKYEPLLVDNDFYSKVERGLVFGVVS